MGLGGWYNPQVSSPWAGNQSVMTVSIRTCTSDKNKDHRSSPSDNCQSKQAFGYHPVHPLQPTANASWGTKPFWKIVLKGRNFYVPLIWGGGIYFHSRKFPLFVTLNLPLQDTRIIRAIIHQTPFTQRITTEHHKIRYFQCLISFNLRHFSKAGTGIALLHLSSAR